MGLSFRHYLFAGDGSLCRVPRRIADELPFGTDAIPEFAGTRQRVAQVILENDERRPVRILDARGYHWTFDDTGRIDEDLRDTVIARMDAYDKAERGKRMRVVDLVPEIKRRELLAKLEWTLTADDLDRIAADLWPGGAGPASEITSVKGKAPKKPPLTNEGRWALDDIARSVMAITGRLSGLSERALKGLAFEAVRMADFEDAAIYRGIADEAKRLEAVAAAHRTGRGEWYAVVELARASRDHPHVWEHITSVQEKCSSRAAAVEAGKRLMAEKADWVGPDAEISVNVRSALEWRAEEWE